MIMLDDAVRANAKEDDVRVLDLSQLLEESLDAEPVTVGAPSPETESAGETGAAGDGPVDPG
jgi:hypothetical protein